MEYTKKSDINDVMDKNKLLLSSSQSDLTSDELKLLDIYSSLINTQNSESRTVTFSKSSLEEIPGQTDISIETLQTRLKHLTSTVVTIYDDNQDDGFIMTTLFEQAIAKKDREGNWQISMMCTPAAQKFFFAR